MISSQKGISHDLLEKAHCVVIGPGLKKGALVVGGEYGKGFMSSGHPSLCPSPVSAQFRGAGSLAQARLPQLSSRTEI
jgi:lipid-binding SYLF domain-containing protein